MLIMQVTQENKAQLVLLNANIIWGVTPIFLEIVLQYLTPLQTTTIRFGVAVLLLSILLFLFKGRNGFSLLSTRTVIVLGWLDAFGYLGATIGQDMTTPGLATLLSSFYVFMVPFIAWKLEGTKLNLRIILLGLMGLLGIFLISFNGDWANLTGSSISGILVLMFSALLWGFYTVISGKYLSIENPDGKKIDMMSFTFASLFHTSVALFILSVLIGGPSISLPLEILPYVVFLGIFPTIIALGLWNWAIARLGSISTSFFQLLQVIVPFILEFLLLQQFYTSWIYTGIVLILLSTIWIRDSDEITTEKYCTEEVFTPQELNPMISLSTCNC
ncbi:MAG: DMT family transporter [Candidatus Heimdallarchaeota archaeon]|nr:MAG: DMT family transporter [Candidatus Heimdallarchaeota archaeon]